MILILIALSTLGGLEARSRRETYCAVGGVLQVEGANWRSYNCWEYYSCLSGVATLKSCPAGEHFNTELKRCDSLIAANCFCRKKPNGVHLLANLGCEPAKYVKCENYQVKTEAQSCPNGSYFYSDMFRPEQSYCVPLVDYSNCGKLHIGFCMRRGDGVWSEPAYCGRQFRCSAASPYDAVIQDCPAGHVLSVDSVCVAQDNSSAVPCGNQLPRPYPDAKIPDVTPSVPVDGTLRPGVTSQPELVRTTATTQLNDFLNSTNVTSPDTSSSSTTTTTTAASDITTTTSEPLTTTESQTQTSTSLETVTSTPAQPDVTTAAAVPVPAAHKEEKEEGCDNCLKATETMVMLVLALLVIVIVLILVLICIYLKKQQNPNSVKPEPLSRERQDTEASLVKPDSNGVTPANGNHQ